MSVFIFFVVVHHSLAQVTLVDHSNEGLGITLKIPYSWIDSAFARGKTQFIPTPTEGSFLMISVLEPEKGDYSAIDLEFFMADLIFMSEEEDKIKDFKYQKITLSALPAYDVIYTLNREKTFRIHMYFVSANEKIYMIQYQALLENFNEYDSLIEKEIIPSFKIQVIHHSEMRYQFQEVPEFGFSFFYPATWRTVLTSYAVQPMPLYTDPNTGSLGYMSASSGEQMSRVLRKQIVGEGIVLGRNDPILIAPDPDSIVRVSVFGLAYQYEPADIIAGYVKALRDKIKDLEGFEHLRQFPIEIDGKLTMEYSYRYKDKKDDKEVTIYVTSYITYANERLYHISYDATDENFTKHSKEVQRLLKYFKFIPVRQ